MPRIIFNGEEGEAFINETPRVLYQFHASLENTCGTCLQYHLAVSSYWPIPIHRNCRCRQTLVLPGQTAEPWVDFRKVLDGLGADQKREAVGASNYKLLKGGVVEWGDVVTNARVRTFREVVAREKLTVPELTAAGVRESVARAAWESVHTPAHEIARAHRKTLVDQLANAGVSPQQVKERFGAGMAARVRIAGPHGPGGPVKAAPGPIEPLIELLGLDKKKARAALAPKAPKAKPFAPSKAVVDVTGGDRGKAARTIQKVFGVDFPVHELASLIGAPDGVAVAVLFEDVVERITYAVKSDGFLMGGDFRRVYDPEKERHVLEHHVDMVHVPERDRGKGIGAEIHGRQVQFGAERGVERLTLHAKRDEGWNGYVTWPIFGYDGAIPEKLLPKLPESLRGRKTIQELMGDEEGQRWWIKDGEGVDLTFPLGEGSPGVKLWEAYRKRKAGE